MHRQRDVMFKKKQDIIEKRRGPKRMLKTVTRRIFSSCPQCEPSVDKNVIIPRKSFSLSLSLSLSSIENGLDFSPHPVRHSPLQSRENVNFRARQQQQQQPVRNKRAKNRSITRRVRNNLSATASVCLLSFIPYIYIYIHTRCCIY